MSVATPDQRGIMLDVSTRTSLYLMAKLCSDDEIKVFYKAFFKRMNLRKYMILRYLKICLI